MKKIKAALPTVCYTALLLAIALLSFLIAGKSSDKPISAEEKTVLNPQETTQTQPNTYDSSPIKEDLTENPTETPIKTAILPYDDVFPRRSQNGKQKIYGDGNVFLYGVTQTAVGNFLVVASDCANGDVPCEKTSLAIIKTNNENDLVSYVVLGENEQFLTMQLSTLGLVVLSENETRAQAVVRVVDTDLTIKNEYKISSPISVCILPTEDSFLVFADYENECIIYRYLNEKLIFQSVEKGNIVELFEKEDAYLLFCNKNDGSYCLTIEKERLTVKNTQKISDSALLGIAPVYNDGLFFITIENETVIKIRKYDATFTCIESKEFGACNVKKTYPTNQGLILLCNGSVDGYAVVTSDLTFNIQESTALSSSKIIAFTADEKGFYYLMRDEDNAIFFMGKEPIGQAENASFLLAPNGDVLLYLEKKDEYGRRYIEMTTLPENR